VGADADSGKENDESRAPIDAAAAAAAARALRERTVAVIGAAATLGTSRPGVMNAESIETPERPVTLLPRRPVVVIVEDTESFDNRVLSDLLLALSDAGDTLPVCVLLGVATSASMMHGIIPAAVAARLRVESFSLWSPKAIMTAVQENVLLDPGFVPAPSNAALELLVTRFAEHDFSLSAARRAMHLLALDHFMTRELSSLAMCMTAAMNAAAEATDALADADVDADADAADVDASIARIARLATKKKAIANAASEKASGKGSSRRGRDAHAELRRVGQETPHRFPNRRVLGALQLKRRRRRGLDRADGGGRVHGAAALGGGASMRRRRRDDGAVRARRGEALDASRGRVVYAMARVFSHGDSPTRRPR
jgi:origin recognition complex subunit 3